MMLATVNMSTIPYTHNGYNCASKSHAVSGQFFSSIIWSQFPKTFPTKFLFTNNFHFVLYSM